MDELKITEFAVVGLSVGGMWGAELAVLAPERVKTLMLFDTYLGDETDEAQGSYMTMLNAVDVAGAIQSPLLEHIIAQFNSENASADDVAALKTHLTSLSAETLRTSIVPLGKMIFGRSDRMSILSDITCSAHVATGALDLPRPSEEGQRMAD